ncbi:MAG TPA: lysophospholipid acyltransferase family protein [Pyrinomonadaceae bacterium]|nr:lysophospholipid acyltransferase family protein [Pyrinomonadaceae bacterium]
MSESSPSVDERRRPAKEAQAEPFVLPLWAINIIRVPLYLMSRLFWRIKYEGLENIPQTGGVIIASNHQTYLDPVWMSLPVRREIRYLAWSESFDWPVVGKAIALLGAWPIQIKKADRTAIRRSRQWMKSGGAVVIFPEGGRCQPDGALLPFEAGAARMALESNVPILPITIRGGHRAWPKGKRLPRIHKVELVYHPLQHVSLEEGEDARQASRRETDRLAATIGSAL